MPNQFEVFKILVIACFFCISPAQQTDKEGTAVLFVVPKQEIIVIVKTIITSSKPQQIGENLKGSFVLLYLFH